MGARPPIDGGTVLVTGASAGRDIPGWLEISAEQCARDALRGFDRGRALVVPGRVLPIFLWMGRLTVRPVLRRFFGWMARFMRRRSS